MSCASLTAFEFLDTGAALVISEYAFYGTGMLDVILPKNAVVKDAAFAQLRNRVEVVRVWGDTAIEGDSFEGVAMEALRVTSDSSTAAGAKSLYDGWNASSWKYGKSEKIPLLQIDDGGAGVDISGLIPDGQGMIQIINMYAFNNGPSLVGTLQFVEFKGLMDTPFHMVSAKAGVYAAEAHVGSVDVKANLGGVDSSGKTAAKGDGKTWELISEYYTIVFYSFRTDIDSNSNAVMDGEDPDYINSDLTGDDATKREEVGRIVYLAGRDLKSLYWQSFVRYSLSGWYTGDTTTGATSITSNRVTASDAFERDIPESWIYRDPVTDEGTLNLYAMFQGKSYAIQIEARLTGGQQTQNSFNDNVSSSVGGEVRIILVPQVNGSDGITTGTSGANQESYPFGTPIILNAVPNSGYAFVGWCVIYMTENENGSAPKSLFSKKDDRSYLNKVDAARTAVWAFELPSQMRYVAYFAKTTTVNFDQNKSSGTSASVEYVVGDRLVETINDYNGYDYDALVQDPTGAIGQNGKGTSPYPGTPTNTDLTFGGWYSGATPYAQYDSTNLAFPGTYLKDLSNIPNVPNPLSLVAKWYATITFYPDDGANNASLAGAGLTETAASSGVYTYQHDVGTYVGPGYNGSFSYGVGSFTPTISNLSFNGWYVLSGGVTFSNIEAVASGTNNASPYPDIYDTKKRLEPGTTINGHISLMALYVATVEFYFNGADSIAASVTPTSPYSVTVPASSSTYLSDSPFSTINTAMAGADTYKFDTKNVKMTFMGWYVSADGSTPPPS
ncbi:MAG: hypothetical protein LBS92_07900 [Candidatus Methanoplasma sp.]|jgi:hypothetical protein|nr:hypothetical protein [Candidatus Methanoplasma sp.]